VVVWGCILQGGRTLAASRFQRPDSSPPIDMESRTSFILDYSRMECRRKTTSDDDVSSQQLSCNNMARRLCGGGHPTMSLLNRGARREGKLQDAEANVVSLNSCRRPGAIRPEPFGGHLSNVTTKTKQDTTTTLGSAHTIPPPAAPYPPTSSFLRERERASFLLPMSPCSKPARLPKRDSAGFAQC